MLIPDHLPTNEGNRQVMPAHNGGMQYPPQQPYNGVHSYPTCIAVKETTELPVYRGHGGVIIIFGTFTDYNFNYLASSHL